MIFLLHIQLAKKCSKVHICPEVRIRNREKEKVRKKL